MSGPSDYDTRIVTAEHEAGHGVMRWLCGWRLTRLIVHENGTEGLCEGTGRRTTAVESQLLVTLAGGVVEKGYGLTGVLSVEKGGGDSVDLDEARDMLETARTTPRLNSMYLLRVVDPRTRTLRTESVDAALLRYSCIAGELLRPHRDFVIDLGSSLEVSEALSAGRVAAMCREHGKRLGHPWTGASAINCCYPALSSF